MRGTRRCDGEQGVALLVTVILLLMVSAIGLSALNRAGDEKSQAQSSQRKTSTLAAADSGIALVTDQLVKAQAFNMAIVDPQTQTLMDATTPVNEPQLVKDEQGFFTAIRTGTVDSTVPQPVETLKAKPEDGYELKQGEQAWQWRIYRATVVATDTGGGNAQIQAQYKVKELSY